MDFEIVKKHPVAVGAAALIGGLFLYLIIRGGGSSPSASSGSGLTVAAQPTNQYDAAIAQVSAGAAAQETQANASVAIAQLQADTVAVQVAAAVKANQDTQNANVAIAGIQGTTAVSVADIGAAADVAKTVDVAHTQADVLESQIAEQGHVADLQAGLASQQLDVQQSVADNTISLIKSGQLNKGGEGGAHQISALAALLGEPSVSSSAEGGAAASNAASASMWSNIAGAGSKIITGLFG